MQFSQLFTVCLAATLATATPMGESRDLSKRGCYGGGEKWGDKARTAADRAGSFCKDIKGTFQAGKTKHGCYGFDNGNRADFYIQRSASTKGDLSEDRCNSLLQEQIFNCARGGEGDRDGWYYR